MKKQKLGFALGASVAASTSLLALTSSEKYFYDASGNIVEKQIGDKLTQFEYTGNLLKGSSQGASQKKISYDSAGRLIQEAVEGTITRKMEYQFGDKVTKVEKDGRAAEFFYNAEGQLVGTRDGGKVNAYAWDGLAIVLRGEQAYTVEGHQVGGVPTMTNGKVVVSDPNGTTLSIGYNSISFSAYGEGSEGGFFTGKPYLEDLENFIFKFRSYSPDNARWTTVDPSGYPDGVNNYQYTNSDPVNFYDPNGLHKLVWKPSNNNKLFTDRSFRSGHRTHEYRLNGSIAITRISESSARATLTQNVKNRLGGSNSRPWASALTAVDMNQPQSRSWRISCDCEGEIVVNKESGIPHETDIDINNYRLLTYVSVTQNSDFVVWDHMAQWDPQQESGINSVGGTVIGVGFNVGWTFAKKLNNEWGHTNTFEFDCEQ